MSTALNTMGLKRICMGCGTRFYDMNKRPIICPSCDAEFTGDVKVKSRRGRVAAAEPKVEDKAKAAAVVEEEEILEEDEGVEVVSLDDVDEKSSDEDDDTVLDDDDDLDGIPDFEGDIDDDLGDDDSTILEDDD